MDESILVEHRNGGGGKVKASEFTLSDESELRLKEPGKEGEYFCDAAPANQGPLPHSNGRKISPPYLRILFRESKKPKKSKHFNLNNLNSISYRFGSKLWYKTPYFHALFSLSSFKFELIALISF
jgi:hypothetical protein